MLQALSVDGTHVVHAGRDDGFDAWVDLGGAEGEASAGADADDPDPVAVDRDGVRDGGDAGDAGGVAAQEVDGGAEGFGV